MGRMSGNRYRVKSVGQLLNMREEVLELSERFRDAFGRPEAFGVWFVWGESGSGKTSFILQLCKELSQYGKIIYDSFEEGFGLSLRNRIKQLGVKEVSKRFMVLDKEPISRVSELLSKRKSAHIAVVDSFQYAQLTYKQYLAFKELHPKKLIIFIAPSEGKNPAGMAAKKVRYDASLKIYVEKFRAFSKGRFIGEKGYYDIWQEEAQKHWGE
ncbi:hypothetical protein EZS27_012344 [termite gut metagenome]|uniref:AAA+ ATPase domain-containing protein n=1 Tax=termite gut metagenome TaxID=433724 RepID=A0A5J4S0U0_9ZZZZ